MRKKYNISKCENLEVGNYKSEGICIRKTEEN